MLLQTKIAWDETVTVPKIQVQRQPTSSKKWHWWDFILEHWRQLQKCRRMWFILRFRIAACKQYTSTARPSLPHPCWTRQLAATFKKVAKIFALLAHIMGDVATSSHVPLPPTQLLWISDRATHHSATSTTKWCSVHQVHHPSEARRAHTSSRPSGTSDGRATLDPNACRTDSARLPCTPPALLDG